MTQRSEHESAAKAIADAHIAYCKAIGHVCVLAPLDFIADELTAHYAPLAAKAAMADELAAALKAIRDEIVQYNPTDIDLSKADAVLATYSQAAQPLAAEERE